MYAVKREYEQGSEPIMFDDPRSFSEITSAIQAKTGGNPGQEVNLAFRVHSGESLSLGRILKSKVETEHPNVKVEILDYSTNEK